MIDGLKLTMTGEELRKRLDERVKEHERLVAWYKREAKREPDPDDEYDFVMPEHMCEYEVELHSWRAKALAYIRQHIEGGEGYRLGEQDLVFGEILPVKPGMVQQEDYEREQRVGFSLERIAKEMGRSRFDASELAALIRADGEKAKPRQPRAATKPRRRSQAASK